MLSSTQPIKAPARFLVFVCGDFNSKLDKRTAADMEAGLNSCIGSHGLGTRNDNGEALANLLVENSFCMNYSFSTRKLLQDYMDRPA